jgi:hypothetical protein
MTGDMVATTGTTGDAEPRSLEGAVAAVTAAVRGGDPGQVLDALVALRWAQNELENAEHRLITAARAAGVSWQALAPALGVASRQAAERRYLRLTPPTGEQDDSTQDGRVRAERDRRAGHRAVARWANDHTADLRSLAGRITSLTDLGDAASPDVERLHDALAGTDAGALPALLAGTHRHLGGHPELADQVDTVLSRADQVRRRTQQRRDRGRP